MKRLMLLAIATGTVCAALNLGLAAQDPPPGQVDFGTFSPPKDGGEFVEVNVPPNLIWLASRLVEKDEPDLAQLLSGLKLVRVNVIGVTDDNRGEIESKAKKVRQELAGKGWERIVTAQEKNQDVSVYLKMATGGAVQGLAAVILDNKEHAVFVNIVGEIKPEQLAMLGEKLHIDPLKQLGPLGEKSAKKHKPQTEDKAGEKAED